MFADSIKDIWNSLEITRNRSTLAAGPVIMMCGEPLATLKVVPAVIDEWMLVKRVQVQPGDTLVFEPAPWNQTVAFGETMSLARFMARKSFVVLAVFGNDMAVKRLRMLERGWAFLT